MTIKRIVNRLTAGVLGTTSLLALAQVGAGPGTLYPAGAPMPNTAMPGSMMMGAPQPRMGEVPAYAQMGGNGCFVDRYGDTRVMNSGGVPGPVGPQGH